MEAEPEHWTPTGAPKERRDGKKSVKLPETPKTAEEMWQHSVIGDYLAKYRVRPTPLTDSLAVQRSDSLLPDLLNRATAGRPRWAWRPPGSPWRRRRRFPGLRRQRRTRSATRFAESSPAIKQLPPCLCCNSGGCLQRELLEMRTLPAGQAHRKHKFDGEPKKPPV